MIAELSRGRAEPRFARAAGEPEELVSVLTLAEYDKGIAALPEEASSRSRFAAALAASRNALFGANPFR